MNHVAGIANRGVGVDYAATKSSAGRISSPPPLPPRAPFFHLVPSRAPASQDAASLRIQRPASLLGESRGVSEEAGFLLAKESGKDLENF